MLMKLQVVAVIFTLLPNFAPAVLISSLWVLPNNICTLFEEMVYSLWFDLCLSSFSFH